MVKLERHVVNGEALQWTQISFLAGFIKDLGLHRTIWKMRRRTEHETTSRCDDSSI